MPKPCRRQSEVSPFRLSVKDNQRALAQTRCDELGELNPRLTLACLVRCSTRWCRDSKLRDERFRFALQHALEQRLHGGVPALASSVMKQTFCPLTTKALAASGSR